MPDLLPFRLLLKNSNFRRLWTSQLLSQLTINLVNFALLTRLFFLTRSTIAVSLLWVAYSLPALFFGLFAGSIVDNFSLRKTMLITNLLQSLVIAMYLLTTDQLFLIYSIVFLYSALDQLYIPAQQAAIPWLVPKDLLPVANGIFLLTQQGSFLVGFGMGGIFLTLLGHSLTIMISAAFLLLAAASVYFLPSDIKKPDLRPFLDRVVGNIKNSYSFIMSHPGVQFPMGLVVISQVFITIVALLLPSYTFQVLGLDLNHTSLLLIVPAALGAVWLTSRLPAVVKRHRKKTVIESGLLVAGISLFLLFLIGFVGSLKVYFSPFIALLFGTAVASILSPAHTLLQEYTPEGFRGQVYGLLGFLMTITTAVPLLVVSSIADIVGVGTMMGLLALLILAGFWLARTKADSYLKNKLNNN